MLNKIDELKNNIIEIAQEQNAQVRFNYLSEDDGASLSIGQNSVDIKISKKFGSHIYSIAISWWSGKNNVDEMMEHLALAKEIKKMLDMYYNG